MSGFSEGRWSTVQQIKGGGLPALLPHRGVQVDRGPGSHGRCLPGQVTAGMDMVGLVASAGTGRSRGGSQISSLTFCRLFLSHARLSPNRQ